MQASLSIPNGTALHRALRRLPEEAQNEAILGLKKAAREVKEYAAANHEFKDQSGTLSRSINWFVNERLLEAKVGVNIKGSGRRVPYANAVHYGYPAREIVPRNRRVLRWQGADGFAFATKVRHPGYKGDPFLDNALKQKEPEIVRLIVDGVEAAIRKAGFR